MGLFVVSPDVRIQHNQKASLVHFQSVELPNSHVVVIDLIATSMEQRFERARVFSKCTWRIARAVFICVSGVLIHPNLQPGCFGHESRAQGGSKTTSTWTSLTVGKPASFRSISDLSTSPIPQPGAVMDIVMSILCPPSISGIRYE